MPVAKSIVCTVIIVLVIGLAGCTKENNKFVSRFTVLNAVPNSSGFSLLVGGELVEPSAYYALPDYYLEAKAATTTVQWKHNSAGGVDSSFFTDVSNNTDFILLFYDSLAKKKTFFVKDIISTTASKDKAYLRFFPLIITDSVQRITNDTSKVLLSKRFGSFEKAGADFTLVDTITTKLKLYLGSNLLDSLPVTHLQAGKSYTIYAVGVNNEVGDKKPKMFFYEH